MQRSITHQTIKVAKDNLDGKCLTIVRMNKISFIFIICIAIVCKPEECYLQLNTSMNIAKGVKVLNHKLLMRFIAEHRVYTVECDVRLLSPIMLIIIQQQVTRLCEE